MNLHRKSLRRWIRLAKIVPVKVRKNSPKFLTLCLFTFFLTAIYVQLTPPIRPNLATSAPPVIPLPTAIPIPASSGTSLPAISARNVFIMDRNSKAVLYHQLADSEIAPASTTKIVTALVTLENFSLGWELLRQHTLQVDTTAVQLSHTKPLGPWHRLESESPIFIVRATKP